MDEFDIYGTHSFISHASTHSFTPSFCTDKIPLVTSKRNTTPAVLSEKRNSLTHISGQSESSAGFPHWGLKLIPQVSVFLLLSFFFRPPTSLPFSPPPPPSLVFDLSFSYLSVGFYSRGK